MEITEFLVTAASSIAILTFVVGAFTWYARTWLKTQFEGNVAQLLPKLVNDDTSVARYAHQARDAATEAKDAACDARDAAGEVKEVAYEIRDVVKMLRRETKTYYVTHTKDGKELAVRDINDC
jgi:predicted RNA-binding Zn ribbon-like protein